MSVKKIKKKISKKQAVKSIGNIKMRIDLLRSAEVYKSLWLDAQVALVYKYLNQK